MGEYKEEENIEEYIVELYMTLICSYFEQKIGSKVYYNCIGIFTDDNHYFIGMN